MKAFSNDCSVGEWWVIGRQAKDHPLAVLHPALPDYEAAEHYAKEHSKEHPNSRVFITQISAEFVSIPQVHEVHRKT